ncbi:glutamine amidotransferase [Dickeya lacustris]|uniref:Glutamine amidotransferase n=1 Tax=Dickeya lacustris TaxID=2259638 RepID=A0ABY8GA31_9GAMM|nr:glutamine amidotransferase [Dickeya lacustris]WFN56786.1 glutamine amidotransferase [Dickeya lacustris]
MTMPDATATTPARSLLIVQMGEPPEPIARTVGQQADWFSQALAEELAYTGGHLQVVRPDAGDALPPAQEHDAAIISGSWSMVTDKLSWSERTAQWVRERVGMGRPLLGICYGHQLLAHALGGEVADNPNGREMGLKTVTLHEQAAEDRLLAALPAQFSAYLSHLQSVITPPAGAQVLAASELDGCQIIRYAPHTLSFQFHPEMDAAVMNACLRHSALPELVANEEPVWARRLLRDFVQHALSR